MHRLVPVAAALALSLFPGACNDMPHQKDATTTEPAVAATVTPPPTDSWIGQWPGAEGTFLRIAAGATPGAYAITEGTLDGELTYAGAADGAVIRIVRDGANETIRAGTGADTGLKWLADKTDCLIIKSGVGFCR
jgi:hypothetical protein